MSQVMLESSDRARRSPRQWSSGDEPSGEAINPYASPAHVDRQHGRGHRRDIARAGGLDGRGAALPKASSGLLVTQFLGAMNDNMFRWLIVPIGNELWARESAATVVSAGAIMLVLPFLLFAAPAGYLADRFGKNRVMIACKVARDHRHARRRRRDPLGQCLRHVRRALLHGRADARCSARRSMARFPRSSAPIASRRPTG